MVNSRKCDASTIREASIRPVTLLFSDPVLEAEFQASWFGGTSAINKIWVASGIGFFALFTVLLIVILPPESHGLVWIRYTIALPLIVLVQAPLILEWRLKQLLPVWFLSGTLAAFGTALALFSFSHLGHNLIYLFEMVVIFVYAQHFSRILFRYTVFFTLLAGGSALAVVAIEPTLIPLPYALFAPIVIALSAVGVFSTYARESFVRRNYLAMGSLTAERIRAFELADQSKAADSAKSVFLANMSHELRTPLNAIIGFSEMMENQSLGELKAQYRGYASDINSGGKQLLQIINDILDISQIELGQAELYEEAVRLPELIENCRRLLGQKASESSVSIDIDVPESVPLVRGDEAKLKQILTNLLSNAVKFSKPGGHVHTSARLDSDGSIVIAVRDTEIGMRQEDIPVALTPFKQMDTRLARAYEGTGLGLSITKSLVELHGGSLEIESELGTGTTVTATLPPSRVLGSAKNTTGHLSAA